MNRESMKPEYSLNRASEELVNWFVQHSRSLPWREDYDPYKVMVSEFMLQQTQVDTVLPYFQRWMNCYPNLKALAASSEAEVEKLWEGLGYYSRARNLLKAARVMVDEGFSHPPASKEALMRYPGIGPYTAGAIASIAYNIPVTAIDGNVERVMARFLDESLAAGSRVLKQRAEETVLKMMPKDQARIFNQALMELGASLCAPKKVQCSGCPIRSHCLAFVSRSQLERPLPKVRPATVKIEAWSVLFRQKKLFLLHRRPPKGLWANFWEIPWFPRTANTISSDLNLWGEVPGLRAVSSLELGSIQFAFTHYRVTAWCLLSEVETLPTALEQAIERGEWALFSERDLADLTLAAPSRKFLTLMFDSLLPK